MTGAGGPVNHRPARTPHPPPHSEHTATRARPPRPSRSRSGTAPGPADHPPTRPPGATPTTPTPTPPPPTLEPTSQSSRAHRRRVSNATTSRPIAVASSWCFTHRSPSRDSSTGRPHTDDRDPPNATHDVPRGTSAGGPPSAEGGRRTCTPRRSNSTTNASTGAPINTTDHGRSTTPSRRPRQATSMTGRIQCVNPPKNPRADETPPGRPWGTPSGATPPGRLAELPHAGDPARPPPARCAAMVGGPYPCPRTLPRGGWSALPPARCAWPRSLDGRPFRPGRSCAPGRTPLPPGPRRRPPGRSPGPPGPASPRRIPRMDSRPFEDASRGAPGVGLSPCLSPRRVPVVIVADAAPPVGSASPLTE